MKSSPLLLLLSALSAALLAGAQEYGTTAGNTSWESVASKLLSEQLQRAITTDGLMGNLRDLDDIAKANGGNRAFGLPGYDASRDFILSKVGNSTSWKAWVQDFPALYSDVTSITFRVGDTDYYVFGPTYSPSTGVDGITAPLVLGPNGTTACTAAGYGGLDVQDKMVLVQRDTCPDNTTLAGRIRAAVSAGANSVILYNNVPTKVTGGTLSAPDPVGYRPSGFINQDDGEALKARLEAGEALKGYLQHTQNIEERITQNVLAESQEGDPNNVIMMGAHLDSVKAGAGINDDGSGTSLLLEVFGGLQQQAGFRNKIRLGMVWSGADSIPLVSTTPRRPTISCALGILELRHGGTGQGFNVTPAVFTGGNDYASFMSTLNKPVGGLHTGTGVDQDDCYHQECDGYDNVHPQLLTTNARAAAHVLAMLAHEGHRIIPKAAKTVAREVAQPRLRERSLAGVIADHDVFGFSEVPGERHTSGSCGHDI